jgi:MarR family transcriptional regulator, 2-MHQ and catechol-resistance regulon repressor
MPKPPSASALPTLGQEIGKRRPFDSAEEEAFLNVMRTASVLTSGASRFIKGFGLSEPQYNALRILRGHGSRGVPSQTIGEQLVAQVPDITRLVDRLVERGWAERSRTESDRRVVMVCATKAGLDLLAKMDKPLRKLHEDQLGHMSRGELAAMSKLLVKARGRDGIAEGNVRGRCP